MKIRFGEAKVVVSAADLVRDQDVQVSTCGGTLLFRMVPKIGHRRSRIGMNIFTRETCKRGTDAPCNEKDSLSSSLRRGVLYGL